MCQYPLLPIGDTPWHLVKHVLFQRSEKVSRFVFRPITTVLNGNKMLHFNDSAVWQKKIGASDSFEVLFCHPSNRSHVHSNQ